jgi:hypothetical protein
MKAVEEQTTGENKFYLEGLRFGLETVLCHNDLLSGNILMSNEKKDEVETDGIYICACVYVWIYIYIYIYMCVCIYIYIYI